MRSSDLTGSMDSVDANVVDVVNAVKTASDALARDPGDELGVRNTWATPDRWLTIARWTRYSVLTAGTLLMLVLVVGFNVSNLLSASRPTLAVAQRPASDQIALDIMPVRPGGPAVNFAAYLPETTLSIPAHSLVTITIRNFDLDPTPLPPASPAANVQGTVDGVAYADGQAYSALDRTKIAHTFTVPAFHLNVPIPGVSASGQRYVIVTFRVRTDKPGVYAWHCVAPCGEGPAGEEGSMADEKYMRGMLIVTN
ncbi:MAG TPA: hypothetical protein VF725_11275 [Ktedonobacterales bacterium]